MTPNANNRSLEQRGYKTAVISILITLLLLGWVIQGTIGLERTLLNREHYQDLIEDLNLYPALQTYLLKQLAEGREVLLSEDSLFTDAVRAAVSEDWVRQQTEAFITETLIFVKGQQQRLLLVADLHDRERVFREALLKGLLAEAPPQLDQLELPKAALKVFVDQLDFPDQITLVNLSKEELPDPSRRALNLLQLARGLLQFLPYLFSALLILLCICWVGTSGGLIRAGGALIGSALSYLALITALRPVFSKHLTQMFDESDMLQALFADKPAVIDSAVAATVAELSVISYVYGTIGFVLLAAGLTLYGEARRKSANSKS